MIEHGFIGGRAVVARGARRVADAALSRSELERSIDRYFSLKISGLQFVP
jgi:hypothetical protein